MSEVRETIFEEIQRTPGTHFNELVRRLGLARGQVQYHVRLLTTSERVIQESLWGRTHYFPNEVPPEDRRAIAVLRRETANAIVSLLLKNDNPKPKEIASRLGLARSTVEYHLDRLSTVDIIEKKYALDGTIRISIMDAERARRLLRATDPDMVDRLTDRFGRLVDNLLDGRN